ncbi:MAG: hypothetical protein IPM81_01765 [Saprospirales bacterium]|nr:hypothetical protein [Saprospirales bacterium]
MVAVKFVLIWVVVVYGGSFLSRVVSSNSNYASHSIGTRNILILFAKILQAELLLSITISKSIAIIPALIILVASLLVIALKTFTIKSSKSFDSQYKHIQDAVGRDRNPMLDLIIGTQEHSIEALKRKAIFWLNFFIALILFVLPIVAYYYSQNHSNYNEIVIFSLFLFPIFKYVTTSTKENNDIILSEYFDTKVIKYAF